MTLCRKTTTVVDTEKCAREDLPTQELRVQGNPTDRWWLDRLLVVPNIEPISLNRISQICIPFKHKPIWEGLIHMEIKNFGTVYLDGQPYFPGAESNGRVISFGDTVSEKAIPFVRWKSLWVASLCVCSKISWDDLNDAGFIFGRLVKIDGVPYLCRSLKVGEDEGAPNEWDDILDDLGEDDSLWHWDEQFFWGQETSSHLTSSRAVRGGVSARRWNYYNAATRHVLIGFRPALETLPPAPLISATLIGARLKVYGPDADIAGELTEVTDYDLVMAPNAGLHLPRKCQWARRDGKRIIVDRTAIVWIKEE